MSRSHSPLTNPGAFDTATFILDKEATYAGRRAPVRTVYRMSDHAATIGIPQVRTSGVVQELCIVHTLLRTVVHNRRPNAMYLANRASTPVACADCFGP